MTDATKAYTWLGESKFNDSPFNKVHQIFARADVSVADNADQRFFKDASWQLALIPDTVELYSWPLIEPAESDEESFRIAKKLLWPALDRSIRELKSPPLVFTNLGLGGDDLSHGGLLMNPWVLADVRQRIRESHEAEGLNTLRLYSFLFDQSAQWGLIGHPEHFSILGGTREFMSKFYDACGGKQVLRDVFELFADEDDHFDMRVIFSTIRASLVER